jgi:hypothetical protein
MEGDAMTIDKKRPRNKLKYDVKNFKKSFLQFTEL